MADVITFLIILCITVFVSAFIGLCWLIYLGYCVARGERDDT